GRIGNACAPVGQRPRPHHDARAAGQWPYLPDQADGTVEAIVAAPARGEVQHFHHAAVPVAQQRAQDRGVGQVTLLAVGEIFHLDREVTALLLVGAQQCAERGIAVECGQAAPHHACARVDQRAKAAVADNAQVKRGFMHCRSPYMPVVQLPGRLPCAGGASAARSQWWTAPMSGNAKRAWLGWRLPTKMPAPPSSAAALKPCSSVRSSPTHSGRRPRKGGRCISCTSARPLSWPSLTNSTTWFPGCSRTPGNCGSCARAKAVMAGAAAGALRQCSASA